MIEQQRKPVLGILTSPGPRGFRGNVSNFRDICLTARQQGLLAYVFTSEGVDFSRRRMTGYWYDRQTQSWRRRAVPFPDVVYNRIPSRREEKQFKTREVLRRFQEETDSALFNPSFLNKWNLYVWLSQEAEILPYLPESVRYSHERLRQMLKRHGTLYLKPISGKAGNGIYRLEGGRQTYRLRLQYAGRCQTWQSPFLNQLLPHLPARPRTYMIQQAVDLATYSGRRFDMRMLIQKDHEGLWQISGTGIRVAGERSITTHVPQGGFTAKPERVLPAVFGQEKADAILQEASNTATRIAEALEKRFRLLGELSMDMGIDREGRIWFFEANSKPMKFDEKEIRRLSLTRLCQFCSHLAGYPPREESE